MPKGTESSCLARTPRALPSLSVFSVKCFDFLQMELSPNKFH
jgi:hypothetical protein